MKIPVRYIKDGKVFLKWPVDAQECLNQRDADGNAEYEAVLPEEGARPDPQVAQEEMDTALSGTVPRQRPDPKRAQEQVEAARGGKKGGKKQPRGNEG